MLEHASLGLLQSDDGSLIVIGRSVTTRPYRTYGPSSRLPGNECLAQEVFLIGRSGLPYSVNLADTLGNATLHPCYHHIGVARATLDRIEAR